MGGVDDAGAVGELAHGRGQHQRGGAAVRCRQRTGGEKNLEGAEQRVVAPLTRGARVTLTVRAGVWLAQGVEQGLEVLGRLAGQLAGDRR